MVVVEMESRIQSPDQNELTEITYKMTKYFPTDFQEFKANTAEKIDKIACLIWENVMGYDTVQTEDMKSIIDGSSPPSENFLSLHSIPTFPPSLLQKSLSPNIQNCRLCHCGQRKAD